MRISDWSSDVCSSDLPSHPADIERLCRLLDSGRGWIKTSLTRITRRPGDYLDLSGIAAKLASNFPEQCVWGSDWPHVMTAPPVPEIAPMIEFFRKTLNEDQFKALMWKNPERLYGFKSAERRVGKECGSTGRSRWSPSH